MEHAETIHDPEYLAAQQAEEEARAREAEAEEETEAKVENGAEAENEGEESMEVDPSPTPPAPAAAAAPVVLPPSSLSAASGVTAPHTAPKTGITCLPQRAALLKSMLNFLKKAIQVVFQCLID